MSTALQYNLGAITRLQERIGRLGKVDRRGLLRVVGAEVETQTKRRIETEKSSPDGIPWAAWSERHAATRHGGHSALEEEGHLLGSIDHQVVGDSVEIGSNLVYARIQQFGSAADSFQNIPARPFIGLSGENRHDVEAIVDNFIDGVLGL